MSKARSFPGVDPLQAVLGLQRIEGSGREETRRSEGADERGLRTCLPIANGTHNGELLYSVCRTPQWPAHHPSLDCSP